MASGAVRVRTHCLGAVSPRTTGGSCDRWSQKKCAKSCQRKKLRRETMPVYNGYQGYPASTIGFFVLEQKILLSMREWQQEWLLSSILGSPAAPSDFGGELPGQSVCPGGRLVPVTETLPDFAARGISGHLLGDIGSEPSQHEVDHA